MTLNQLHLEAVESLIKSKHIAQKLATICPDWTAKEMLRVDYEQLEQTLHDFGSHQLGLRIVHASQ